MRRLALLFHDVRQEHDGPLARRLLCTLLGGQARSMDTRKVGDHDEEMRNAGGTGGVLGV
jgi:hypothetical protein